MSRELRALRMRGPGEEVLVEQKFVVLRQGISESAIEVLVPRPRMLRSMFRSIFQHLSANCIPFAVLAQMLASLHRELVTRRHL